jgi:hypothetical protein
MTNRIAISDRACKALVNSSSAELRQRDTCPSGLSCASQRVVEARILETGKGRRARVPQDLEVQAIVQVNLESSSEIASG